MQPSPADCPAPCGPGVGAGALQSQASTTSRISKGPMVCACTTIWATVHLGLQSMVDGVLQQGLQQQRWQRKRPQRIGRPAGSAGGPPCAPASGPGSFQPCAAPLSGGFAQARQAGTQIVGKPCSSSAPRLWDVILIRERAILARVLNRKCGSIWPAASATGPGRRVFQRRRCAAERNSRRSPSQQNVATLILVTTEPSSVAAARRN